MSAPRPLSRLSDALRLRLLEWKVERVAAEGARAVINQRTRQMRAWVSQARRLGLA